MCKGPEMRGNRICLKNKKKTSEAREVGLQELTMWYITGHVSLFAFSLQPKIIRKSGKDF